MKVFAEVGFDFLIKPYREVKGVVFVSVLFLFLIAFLHPAHLEFDQRRFISKFELKGFKITFPRDSVTKRPQMSACR